MNYYDLVLDPKRCWIDTETSGLDPDRHEVIEICLISGRNADGSPRIYQQRFIPSSDVDPGAAAVNGYHPDTWGGKHKDANDLAIIREMTANKMMCGFNVGFDLAMAGADFKRIGESAPWSHRKLDVQALAVLAVAMGLIPEYVETTEQGRPIRKSGASLAGCVHHFGLGIQQHTAYQDIVDTIGVLEKFIKLFRVQDVIT